VLREPREYFLRSRGSDEHLRRRFQSHPLTGIRSEGDGLPTLMRKIRIRLGVGFRVARETCGSEAESQEDSACLMRREVGSIQAGGARDDLLRRVAPATHDHVVLLDRFGQDASQSLLDSIAVELD